MKTDPSIDAIRKVRSEISRDFGHDPSRLLAHYRKLEQLHRDSPIIHGPEHSVKEPKS